MIDYNMYYILDLHFTDLRDAKIQYDMMKGYSRDTVLPCGMWDHRHWWLIFHDF